MTALPAISDLTGSSRTEAQAKTWFTDLRSYLSGLFGATGEMRDAQAALGIGGIDPDQSPSNDQLGSAAFSEIGQIPLNIWPMTKSSAYQVTPDDNGRMIVVSGTTTITLPSASNVYDASVPFCVMVKAVTGATVTVARSGSDTIETVAGNKSMTANTGLIFYPTSTTSWETI